MVFPLVSDIDRDWAIKQCPHWASANLDDDDGEIVDDGGWLENASKQKLAKPNWADFVIEQIERFEKFFAGQDKSYADWSALWRRSWWPKADPYRRWPSMGKKEFQPFFRRGSKEFARALAVATPEERQMWKRFGIAQFKPTDPRLPEVEHGKQTVMDRIIGEGDRS